jgi:S-DNA-T family DNA segregation ATPase FtsK/SpoIIIE
MAVRVLAPRLTFGRAAARSQAADRRHQYLRYVARIRAELRLAERQQRIGLLWRHPNPVDLQRIVADRRRLWERRPSDPDFGLIRLCVASQDLALKLVPPRTAPLAELDPSCSAALRTLIQEMSVVPDLPVALDLLSFRRVLVRGDPTMARAMVRAMLCQLLVFHGPDDVVLGRDCDQDGEPHWRWLDDLPHLGDTDTLAARRGPWQPAETTSSEPLLVRVRDSADPALEPFASGRASAVVIEVSRGPATPPGDGSWLVVEVDGSALSVVVNDRRQTLLGEPDRADAGLTGKIAASLRPLLLPNR